jgi:hypothetical protein
MPFEIFIENKNNKNSIMKSDKNCIDDFEILALVTSKTTSKAQQPRRLPSGFYFKLHF